MEECQHNNTETIRETDWDTKDVTFTTVCKDCGKVLNIEVYEHDDRL